MMLLDVGRFFRARARVGRRDVVRISAEMKITGTSGKEVHTRNVIHLCRVEPFQPVIGRFAGMSNA